MESIRISSMQELVLHQVASLLSILFFLVMVWLTWVQVRLWRANPEVIANRQDLRKSIIAMALLIGLGVFLAYSMTLELDFLPLAFGLAVGMAAAFISSMSALALFLILIILRPWEILPPDALILLLPRASGILVFVVLANRFLREKSLKIFWSKECTLMALFVLWTFLSATQSSDSAVSLNLYFDVMGRAAIVFFLILNLIKKKGEPAFVLKVLVSAVLSLCVLVVFYHLISPPDESGDPNQRLAFVGMLGDPNDISSFAVMALPFALWPLWRKMTSINPSGEKAGVLDWLIAGLYVVSFVMILYMAQSRGAILATAAFLGLVFMYSAKWSRKSIVIGLVCAAAVLPTTKLLIQRESEDLDESENNRLIFWKTAVRMALKHPVFGVGYGDFPVQYESYLADTGSSEYGKRTAHSSWFLILAENGFVGLAFFVGLFGLCVKRAIVLRHEYPEFLFSLISYGVAMSFLSHSYVIFPYLLFALTIIFSSLYERERGLKNS